MSDRLLDGYDAVLLDLDGTVYRGGAAVPGAAEAVRDVRDGGTGLRFVTNNASRSPAQVAAHLSDLGIPADPVEVCTSAQAAAAVLADRLPPGSAVLVVGAETLNTELRQVGLRPVAEASANPVAVVQGLSKDLGWRELSEACLAVRAGATWVACNIDPTLPTERGEVIGNGALVAAVSVATGRQPVVAGKPNRPLMDQAARSAGARHPLVVGDRLDTDIAGAAAAGLDALLVLTGVTRPADILSAAHAQRPRYVAADLAAMSQRQADAEIADQPEWVIGRQGHSLTVRWTGGTARPDPIGLLRGLCAAHVPDGDADVELVAEDGVACAALSELGLATDRIA